MAIVGSTYPDLKDKLAQMEGGKVTNTIIELLSQTNTILEDAVTKECNDGSSHKTTVRNGLPDVEFRAFYGGVKCSKSSYTQVTDATGMIEQYSKIDQALADKNGDASQFRLNEANGHLEAMNQTVQENIFYGSKKTNPLAFDGLATRYNKISDDKNSIGHYIIDGGGAGDANTSIWFVTWGDLHTHLLYPKGSKAGIQHTNLGVQTVKADDDSGEFQAYRDHFKWDLGLSVRDYRSTCRVANIDVSKLDGDSAADLTKLLVKGYHRIKRFAKTGRTIIYANETIETFLHLQAMNKSNVNLNIEQFAGKPVVTFLGIPVKCVDQILDTESAVAA